MIKEDKPTRGVLLSYEGEAVRMERH